MKTRGKVFKNGKTAAQILLRKAFSIAGHTEIDIEYHVGNKYAKVYGRTAYVITSKELKSIGKVCVFTPIRWCCGLYEALDAIVIKDESSIKQATKEIQALIEYKESGELFRHYIGWGDSRISQEEAEKKILLDRFCADFGDRRISDEIVVRITDNSQLITIRYPVTYKEIKDETVMKKIEDRIKYDYYHNMIESNNLYKITKTSINND